MIYLIHFTKPYKRARHYMGYTKDVDERIARHRKGQGARLCEVVVQAGIELIVVRLWKGNRKRERQLKTYNGGSPVMCPICCEKWNTHAKKGHLWP